MTTGTDSHLKDTQTKPGRRVRQIAVPPGARARSTLSRIDYEDAFRVERLGAQNLTGEQWARAVLDGAPMVVRRHLWWGWLALGLKLGWPGCDEFVLGWEVRRSTPDYVLLGAGSRLGMPAELLFERQQDTLLFATFVQHRNPIMRTMWAAIEGYHRQVVPRLLALGTRPERCERCERCERLERLELSRPHALAPAGQRLRHRRRRDLLRAPSGTRLSVARGQAGALRVPDRAGPPVVDHRGPTRCCFND